MKITRWSPTEARERMPEAMAVYAEAMGYPAEAGQHRAGFALAHTRRPAFRAVAALAPGLAERWLRGAFELSELHVRPAYQGRGAGRALLRTLVDRLEQPAVLLSTPEGDTRAWRLYRSLGFTDLLRHHLFPGDARPFAVLGVRLPLVAARA